MQNNTFKSGFGSKEPHNLQPHYNIYNSVLDNIGTFRHFEPKTKGTSRHAKDFYLLYYRRKNLQLQKKLEGSKLYFHPAIQATCKALACCSSSSLVEQVETGTHHITHTSAKCKSKYCLICSRIAANKNVRRFISKTADEDHKDWFSSRRFYFFTATLKHDPDTRTDNYLAELKKYINQLQRSKLWRDSFIKSKDKMNYGGINSIELTITKNGYHIHLHTLICCPALSRPVNDIQKDLQSAWLKVTGDSHQVRLDLLKLDNMNSKGNDAEFKSCPDLNVVAEVFKYAIKSESISNLKNDDIDQFANWIIETKGKNFVNAFGYFRKLGLISRKKELVTGEPDTDESIPTETLLTKTINIAANFPQYFTLSKSIRRQIMTYSNLTGITDTYFILTGLRDLAMSILKSSLPDETMIPIVLDELQRAKSADDIFDKMAMFSNKSAALQMNVKVDDDGFISASSISSVLSA